MQFLRESEAVAEQVLEVLFNNSASTIQRGEPATYDTRTFADTDGVKVIGGPDTPGDNADLLVGVAYEDVLPGTYGRFQTGGFCDYAMVANDPDEVTIIGASIRVVPGESYLQRFGEGNGTGVLCVGMELIAANAVITPQARKVFLRCR